MRFRNRLLLWGLGAGVTALVGLGLVQAQTTCTVLSRAQLLSSFDSSVASGAITPTTMRNLVCSVAVSEYQFTLYALTAPATPATGSFLVYMDAADARLKAKGPSGTVTVLAQP